MTRECARPRLRIAGVAVSALGAVASFVGAWALPLWMTILGAGFALLAVGGQSRLSAGPWRCWREGSSPPSPCSSPASRPSSGGWTSTVTTRWPAGIAVLVVAATAIVALLTLTFDTQAATASPASA